TVLRQTWRLAPGMAPLDDSDLRCVTGPDAHSLRESVERIWTAGDRALNDLAFSASEEWAAPQRQAVTLAEASFRRKLTADTSLGDALERFAIDHLKGQTVLVLDAVALQDAGIAPSARVEASSRERLPFWERLGLAYVPCRSGALLTTQQALDHWMRTGGAQQDFASAHETAVTRAAQSGRDGSGRFLSVEQWILTREVGPGLRPVLPDAIAPGWTEWEWAAGAVPTNEVVVVLESGVRLV